MITLLDEETIETTVYDVNYIPDYAKAEEQRQANEIQRQTNEASRIALYEDMEHKRDTDYYRGEKGDKGDDGVSPTATVTQGTGSATITVTDASGTTTAVLYDGEKGEQGDKGDPGEIEFQVVNSLPASGTTGIIYLVPLAEPDISGNNYAEYIWVNNAWELLGKIGVQLDLTDYVKNTDYASPSTAGVIKSSPTTYSTEMTSGGVLRSTTIPYSSYDSTNDKAFIGKGTLENVITGKGLTTKAYVDGLVGDIATAIDNISGEVI